MATESTPLAAGPGSATTPGLRPWLRAALWVLAYSLARGLAFLFPDTGHVLTALWPAGGVGLAALLLLPRRLWPALVLGFCTVGALMDVVWASQPLFGAAGYVTSYMAESLACAGVILWWGGRKPRFDRVREVLALAAGAVLVNALGACIGAGVAGLAHGVAFTDAWTAWFISYGLGILVITPLIVTWARAGDSAMPRGRAWATELVAFGLVWCIACWLVSQPASILRPYVLVGLLAWPALRLGQRASSLAMAVLAAVVVASLIGHRGPSPFGGDDLDGQLLIAQLFLGATSVLSLLLSASQADRRRSDEATRESDRKCHTLFSAIGHGFALHRIILDEGGSPSDYITLDVNPAYAEILGVEPQQVVGKRASEFLPKDELAKWATIFGRVAVAGEPTHYEMYSPLNDKYFRGYAYSPQRGQFAVLFEDATEQRHAEEQIEASAAEVRRMLEASDRSRLALLSLAEDQHAAEAALRESEEKFSKAFRDAPILISITDLETATYVDVNEEALRVSGFNREEVIGHAAVDLGWTTAEDRARLAREVKDHGKILNVEMSFRAKDGRRVDGLVSGEQILIGQRPCLLTVVTDVTQSKQAEEALRLSQQQYRGLFEDAVLGMYRTTPDGRIRMCNLALVRMLGYDSPEELVRRKLEDDGSEPQYPRSRFKEGMEAEGRVVGLESAWKRRDGSTVWVRENAKAVRDETGKVLFYEGTVEDITEQKQVQRQLLDYQTRLRSLASRLALTEERERRNLAERLHDDISQYLAFCKMKLEMIRKAEQDPSLVAGLTQVCDTLGQLLADTRAMTFDLYSPVLKVLGFEAAVSSWLREEVQQKHGIRTEFYDDQQRKCLDDNLKALVFRSVRELLNNAVKYAHADLIRVSISREKDMLCVEVEDDGRGLGPEEAISPNAKGFGLFSIQERLAELGGSIEIDTAPGEGCRVLIRVPLETREDAQA